MKHFAMIRHHILYAILSRKIQQGLILLLQATLTPVYTVALLIKTTDANRFSRILTFVTKNFSAFTFVSEKWLFQR